MTRPSARPALHRVGIDQVIAGRDRVLAADAAEHHAATLRAWCHVLTESSGPHGVLVGDLLVPTQSR